MGRSIVRVAIRRGLGRAESPQCARRRNPQPPVGLDAPTPARIGTGRPKGRSHFSFGGERKVCKRKPAARQLLRPAPLRTAAKPCATLVLGYALHGLRPFRALRPGFGLPWWRASVCGSPFGAVLDLGSLRSPFWGKSPLLPILTAGLAMSRAAELASLRLQSCALGARLFPPSKWAGLFPSAAYRRSAPPQLALGRLK